MVAPISTMNINEAISIITLHPDFEEFTIQKIHSNRVGHLTQFRANIYNDEEFCGEGDLAQDAIIELAQIIKDDRV